MLTKLEVPPIPKHIKYLHADYIEMLVLTHPDRSLSPYDILRRYKQYASIDDEAEFDLPGADTAVNFDQQLKEIFYWLSYIDYRAHAFSNFYPFEIANDFNRIEFNPNVSKSHRLYLFLLLASCLRHFSHSQRNTLATAFEAISAEALRHYIGKNAEVRIFGSGAFCQYEGNKYSKIKRLSEDLNEHVIVDEDYFPKSDSADEGLDVVGWFPTEDSSPGKLVLFGQCACTEEWEEKQNSISFDKWNELITLSAKPINLIFIPFCFRDSHGSWYEKHRMQKTLMIDRLRIVHLLKRIDDPLKVFDSAFHQIIDGAIGYVDED